MQPNVLLKPLKARKGIDRVVDLTTGEVVG